MKFKKNYAQPEQVGEYISALANSAALHDRPHGYVLWGVRNGTHELVGTRFVPGSTKKGNELLEPWLARSLRCARRYPCSRRWRSANLSQTP
ncbi:RNA-binding domain-containing protein [Candidatus Palauibacter sp.]|uniref:RNA-binding domain-containing protein n=1 Tax=Candidatus Palauibacter sp. TaxID=3101350 RepID=UPI003AF25EE0